MNKYFLTLSVFNMCIFVFLILLFNYRLYELQLILPLALSSVIGTSILLYKHKLGFSLVYLTYLALTHLSIPAIELINETPLLYKLGNDDWYFTSFKERAVAIAAIGIAAFSLSVSLVNACTKRIRAESLTLDKKGEKVLHTIGRLFILSFFCYLLFLFATGSLPLFSSYGAYFDALENLGFYPVGLFLYAIGMVLTLANTSKRQLAADFAIISLPAILLISSGNRGEIFYPLASGIGVLIYRGMKIKLKTAVILLFVFFIVIPFVQQNRTIGFENVQQLNFNLDLSDPFIELGYQLRPYFYTYSWLEGGEEYGSGASYAVPVQRLASRLIPFLPRPEYEGQPYNFRERLPGMGYSVISEAYYNYGSAGVAVIMFLLGSALSFLGDLSKSFYRLSFAAGLNAILINNIRNAFSFVPGQVFALIILISICLILQLLLKKSGELKSIYEHKPQH